MFFHGFSWDFHRCPPVFRSSRRASTTCSWAARRSCRPCWSRRVSSTWRRATRAGLGPCKGSEDHRFFHRFLMRNAVVFDDFPWFFGGVFDDFSTIFDGFSWFFHAFSRYFRWISMVFRWLSRRSPASTRSSSTIQTSPASAPQSPPMQAEKRLSIPQEGLSGGGFGSERGSFPRIFMYFHVFSFIF